jgi:hypothetical protein
MTAPTASWDITPKRIIIAIVALALLLVGGRAIITLMFSSGETHTARVRVTDMFEALKTTPPTDMAVTRWYGQRPPPSPDLFGPIYDEFAEFCATHKLMPMKTYEIREARETDEKDRFGAPVVVVSGVANDTPFRLRVQRAHAIAWAD